MSEPVTGIDVSAWQGKVDWAKVARAGYSFAYVKATEGTGYVSPTFREQFDGAKSAGLLVGAYDFARPKGDPTREADLFCHTMGALEPGDLPPALDLEVTDGIGPVALVEWAKTWLARVEVLTSRWPLIYLGPNFWRHHLAPANGALDLTSWMLWEAHYTDAAEPAKMPWPKPQWLIWQHSGSGSVPGVTGKCDVNRFNGSLADLRMLACLNGKDAA